MKDYETLIKQAHKDGTLEPMSNTGEKVLIEFISSQHSLFLKEAYRKICAYIQQEKSRGYEAQSILDSLENEYIVEEIIDLNHDE